MNACKKIHTSAQNTLNHIFWKKKWLFFWLHTTDSITHIKTNFYRKTSLSVPGVWHFFLNQIILKGERIELNLMQNVNLRCAFYWFSVFNFLFMIWLLEKKCHIPGTLSEILRYWVFILFHVKWDLLNWHHFLIKIR